MKRFLHLISLIILFLLGNPSIAQEINYGSNNGAYVEVSGTHIYYEEYGVGVPLLLLHGGLIGSIAHYEQVIPEFARKFRVIAIDSPGHGRSEHPDTLSYQLLADYFSQFIDALELDSVYIIGWSDGGIAALLLAADRPEKVKRILTVGAQFGQSGYTPEGLGFTTATYEEIEKWTDFVNDYQSKGYKDNDFKEFVEDCIQMWGKDPYVPDNKVGKIKCRTMIVMGDRDGFISLEHALEMYREINGSAFFVVPDAGHMVFWDNPKLIATVAIEFFTKE